MASNGVPETATSPTLRTLRQTIFSNFKWLTVSTGITTVSTVVANAMLARKLGASAFGEWAVVAVSASWIAIMRGGIGSHLTRLTSAAPQAAQALLAPCWVLMFAWSVLLGAFGLAMNAALQSPRLALASALAITGTFLMALSYMIVSAFAGRDQMQWSLVDSSQALGFAVIVLFAPAKYLNCLTVASMFLLTSALAAAPSMAVGTIKLKPSIPQKMLRAAGRLARDNLWLVGIQLLCAFHVSIDLCVLRLFRDSTQVGLFAAALKVIVAVRLLPWLLMSSLIPELSRTSMQDRQLRSRVWGTVMNRLLPLEGVFVLMLGFMPASILGFLYSRSYRDSSVALMILGVSLIPHCLWQVLAVHVMSAGQYWTHFLASLFCLVVHAAASVVLIPRYGATGAALAFGIAECAALFGMAMAAARGIGFHSFAGLWRFSACLGISAAAVVVLVLRAWPPLVVFAIALTVYAALLLKAGVISLASLGSIVAAGLRREPS
jgi:O-antigen/teichoic acid export membrane protein